MRRCFPLRPAARHPPGVAPPSSSASEGDRSWLASIIQLLRGLIQEPFEIFRERLQEQRPGSVYEEVSSGEQPDLKGLGRVFPPRRNLLPGHVGVLLASERDNRARERVLW